MRSARERRKKPRSGRRSQAPVTRKPLTAKNTCTAIEPEYSP